MSPKRGGINPPAPVPIYPPLTYPRGALGIMTERKRGERSETRSTGQNTPPLAVRRFAGRAVPARRTRRVWSGWARSARPERALGAWCARPWRADFARSARRFCALQALFARPWRARLAADIAAAARTATGGACIHYRICSKVTAGAFRAACRDFSIAGNDSLSDFRNSGVHRSRIVIPCSLRSMPA